MAREYTTPQTGTVIGVFAPDFASQGSFGIANTDGRFFALFDTASRAITKKGATYGDLYATARESIHEFSHTLGIMHPQNKEEVTLTSPGSYVGPDYFDPNNPNYRNPESPIVETDITNYVSNLTIGIHPEDLLLINNLYNQK